ncbi:hypothetical protein BSKO_13654 [Bryopsis sp. KO-2023]|nr:hypothetical protein BSKO_13654 [Bryopsis sp. KO-2023]
MLDSNSSRGDLSMRSFKIKGSGGNTLPLASLLLTLLLVSCEFDTVWARESMLHPTSQRVSMCPNNCERCNETKCVTCKLGYLLASNGVCFMNKFPVSGCDENCLNCGDGLFCETCKPGFDLNILGSCMEVGSNKYNPSGYESIEYNPSEYGTRWENFKPLNSNYHPKYEDNQDYGYGVHFGGIFLLPCLVVVYFLRALRRSRESMAMALNSENPSGLDAPEVPLQSMPPPMTVAQAEFDASEGSSEQDRLLSGGEGGSDGTAQPKSTPGATVLVIDPEGNIEVGKEEKV